MYINDLLVVLESVNILRVVSIDCLDKTNGVSSECNSNTPRGADRMKAKREPETRNPKPETLNPKP